MAHWKLILAYDGTSFCGWQVQPAEATVQGTLAEALHRITGERVLPQGSGRTDAGVHALGQVASFTLAAPIPAENLQRALNRCLPASIRVMSAEHAPPEFHARHSAVGKTYEYRIFPLKATPEAEVFRRLNAYGERNGDLDQRICPPMLAPFVWPCPWPLDPEALKEAAGHVLGEHDFTTFAAADRDLAARRREAEPSDCNGFTGDEPESSSKNCVRTIYSSHWCVEEKLLVYRVTGSGFLHHMVRNLVGTFVQAGAHRLDPHSIPKLLASRSRAVCGPTAPASGLFLVGVQYPGRECPQPEEDNVRVAGEQ